MDEILFFYDVDGTLKLELIHDMDKKIKIWIDPRHGQKENWIWEAKISFFCWIGIKLRIFIYIFVVFNSCCELWEHNGFAGREPKGWRKEDLEDVDYSDLIALAIGAAKGLEFLESKRVNYIF